MRLLLFSFLPFFPYPLPCILFSSTFFLLFSRFDLPSPLKSVLRRIRTDRNLLRVLYRSQLSHKGMATGETRLTELSARLKKYTAEKMATRLTGLSARLKKYTPEEIVLASDNFSWQLRSESVGIWGSAYKGYIQNDTVVIKFLTSSEELEFESRVKSLSLIRHPHLLSMMGFCLELKCFVYEYIENSCSLLKFVKQNLPWPDRFRIASDIFSALCYIKTAREGPIVPDYLNASNILIDGHRNAKVNVVLKRCNNVCDNPDFVWDVKTFGYVILNLLTGIPGNCVSHFYVRWCAGLLRTLDKTVGEWPMDLAEKLMNLCRRCVDCNPRDDFRKKYIMVVIVKEMNEIREIAQFYCPISKEVMKDPHVAADGFSYERRLQGIEKWLQSHDTSLMTKLKFKNKIFTPNGK